MTNRYGFNGGNEYEDEGELNYSNTFYRKYDAQIGRFTGIDMLAEQFAGINPYQFGFNNPVIFNDPMGDQNILPGRMQKGPDGNYHVGWYNEQLWNNIGFYDWGDGNGGGGGGGGNASGNYSNIMGLSSATVLSKMQFGDKFGQNKTGNYGFWRGGPFETNKSGFSDQSQAKNFEQEVTIGTNKRWVELALFGSYDWGNAKTTLDIAGGIFGSLETALRPGNQWLGKNGKYNNNTWGGNGSTGSRAGAFKAASSYKWAGRAVVGASIIIGGIEVYNGYQKDGGQFGYNAQYAAAGTTGNIVGGWAGAKAGAAAGFAAGVWIGGWGAIPTTIIGAFIGGFGGGYIGGKIGEGSVNYYNGK